LQLRKDDTTLAPYLIRLENYMLLYSSFLLQIDEILEQIITLRPALAADSSDHGTKASEAMHGEAIKGGDRRVQSCSEEMKQAVNRTAEHKRRSPKPSRYPLMWEFLWDFLGSNIPDDQGGGAADTDDKDISAISKQCSFASAAVLETCLKVASSRLKTTAPHRFKRLEEVITDSLGKMQESSADLPPSDHYVELLRIHLEHT